MICAQFHKRHSAFILKYRWIYVCLLSKLLRSPPEWQFAVWGFFVVIEVINDEYYMDLAISMASKAIGQTGINPVVGCVITKDGSIVGMGAHLQRGEAHAEVQAVKMAGERTIGATAYVTLEPCSHFGKTPPCANLLIERGISRVVVAALDPNPLVAGSGIKVLQQAGIEVKVGVLEARAKKLNEIFNHYITTKRPFVTLKSASTLDGRLATKTGSSQWISGAAARAEVHTLRHQHQAIMIGVNTLLQDDPSLTTRLEVEAKQPIPIIVDAKLRTPASAKVIQHSGQRAIVLTTEAASRDHEQQLQQYGVTVVRCGAGEQVDLHAAMQWLGEHEISSILLEGGGKLNGAMLQAGFVNKLVLYYGMKIVGGADSPALFDMAGVELMQDAYTLEGVEVAQVGEDIRIIGYPRYSSSQQ